MLGAGKSPFAAAIYNRLDCTSFAPSQKLATFRRKIQFFVVGVNSVAKSEARWGQRA